MVDSYNVINFRSKFYSVYPPCILGGLMIFPIIYRISPKLTLRRKFIRRASCNLNRFFVFVKTEKFRFSPCLNTVICCINRNIANNFNSTFIGIMFDSEPLLIELKLHKFKKSYFFFQFFFSIGNSTFFMHCQLFIPFIPCLAVIFKFQRHKKCIFIKP